MTHNDHCIVIGPDGSINSLYSDNHPINGMGKMKSERASDIRMGNDQLWYIFQKLPGGREKRIGKGHIKRADAVKEEVQLLNDQLFNTGETLIVSK